MPLLFKPSVAALLHEYIDVATSGPEACLPGAIVHVVDHNNATLFSYASHRHSTQTLFDVYSVTKIVCTIAFMQLVDSNALSLDDHFIIKRHLPELEAKRVLAETGSVRGKEDKSSLLNFEKQHTDITPRMLLNHTNGTGHSLFNARLREYLGRGFDDENETVEPYGTILQSPLMWQPGTHASYGQGFDWLGVLLERVTHRALGDVFHQNLFAKMGVTRSGYSGGRSGSMPTGEGTDHWPTRFRVLGGFGLVPRLRVTRDDTWPIGGHHVETGAMGVVSCVADLGRLLTILLPQNGGVDPVSGVRVLSTESVAEIGKVQLTKHLKNGWGNIRSTDLSMMNHVDLQEPHLDPAGGFGLGCAIQGADRILRGGLEGRSEGSIYWYGAASTDYWVDVKMGFAVVMTGNFFPFGDARWVEFVAGIEGLIYKGLTE
ncbi:beta-lactamase family protein [Paraphaeosphaeria minitans]|uniref:Beta-lactamase family protein n=1 Tax=Paraphaeosphaeria minitans TaxID=565426 RepID=A0A9P6KL08_9PLEO|nr:beta-lactamase family protein [Paraphaeosphaeria minitans]